MLFSSYLWGMINSKAFLPNLRWDTVGDFCGVEGREEGRSLGREEGRSLGRP